MHGATIYSNRDKGKGKMGNLAKTLPILISFWL